MHLYQFLVIFSLSTTHSVRLHLVLLALLFLGEAKMLCSEASYVRTAPVCVVQLCSVQRALLPRLPNGFCC
jgi:hypothetical protein